MIREEIEPRPLWNILLFAIKYDKTDTVEVLLELEELDIMAIVEPPANNQDFHVNRDQYFYNEIKNQIAFEMAIQNKNLTILQLLIKKFVQYYTEIEICQVLKFFTDIKSFWPEGLKSLLKSNCVKVMFETFRPEYKEMFIATSLVEPLL